MAQTQQGHWWRIHVARPRTYAASAAKADRRVLARGIPASHATTCTKLIAVAVITCCTWVLA